MKTALYGVMLSALLTTGCLIKTPFVSPDDADPPGVAPPVRKPISQVRPDQVTPENAPEKAEDLKDEIENDREAPK